ncbi:MAG: CHAT domain-containing protein, partial [candidate division KSB1 bacterium]
MGDIHKDLGEFEEALQACARVEKHGLVPSEIVMLELLRFNVFLSNGHYEQADTALKKATVTAVESNDTDDLIQCLNNRGVWHSRLADDDSALVYYMRADSLLKKASVDLEMRLKVLSNIVGIFSTKNDLVQFEIRVKEAQGVLNGMSSPSMKTFLLHNIGIWYQLGKQYELALRYFNTADSIASQSELLRFVVTIRIDMVDCLIALARFTEATALLEKTSELAKKIDVIEGLINVLDRTVQLQYRTGHCAQAAENSQQLLAAIEKMSLRFKKYEPLIAYRQKIYDLQKNATLCDIAMQQEEAAFKKLIEAKAYALRSRLQAASTPQAEEGKAFSLKRLQAQLQPKQILLDYMITPDTLYVFVLDQNGIRLLHKEINLDALRQTVRAYRDSIHKTMVLFQKYDAQRVQKHYIGTTELGKQLYQILLGWPQYADYLRQAELLYIVPDEFLFEIPFSTLSANAGDAKAFLANQAAVVTLPSANLLAGTNATNGAHHSLRDLKVLVSADRNFPATEKFLAQVKTFFPLAEELAFPDSVFTKDE